MKKIMTLVLVAILALGAGWFFLAPKGEQTIQDKIIGTWTDTTGQKLVFKKDNILEVTSNKGESKLGLWELRDEERLALFIDSKKYAGGEAKLPFVGEIKSMEVNFYSWDDLDDATFTKKSLFGF